MIKLWKRMSLVQRIIVGLAAGIILGLLLPQMSWLSVFGTLFVTALKSVAPVLVLFLMMGAICQHKKGEKTNMGNIIGLYLAGTFCAGAVGVIMSYIFRVRLVLGEAAADIEPPQGLSEVCTQLLTNMVANPFEALINANFLGLLVWAVLLGIALMKAKDTTKALIVDISDAISTIVRWVIMFAPLGVMSLVFDSIASNGLSVLLSYGKIILLLVGAMLVDALVINPIIVFTQIRQNPYPLVLRCLKDSGITAFFTRSSAANIPVNMSLCEALGLDRNTYSISIPLGATINMGGASITISVLTLATCHTQGIEVNILFAIILVALSALSACGASGVPGGSLLLIPLACSLFGIPADVSAQVVGIGFIVAVVQDSCETAINSSTDVLFTATADIKKRKKNGETVKVAIMDKKKQS